MTEKLTELLKRSIVFLMVIFVGMMFSFSAGTSQVSAASKVKTPSQVKWGTVTTGKDYVKLRWKKTNNTTGYKIYRYNAATKKWTLIATLTNATATAYTDTKLKSNTQYKYKVRAYKTYKQKQWFNKKTKKWQKKKPKKKYRGSTRKVTKYKYGKYTKTVKTVKTKAVSQPEVEPINPENPEAPYKECSDIDEFAMAGANLVKEAPEPSSDSRIRNGDFASSRLIAKSYSRLDCDGLNVQKAIFDGESTWLLQFATPTGARNAMKMLSKDAKVEWVEADKIADSEADKGTSSFKSWGVERIEADQYAASLASLSGNVSVAVVDTGVADHAFLEGRIRNDGFDFVDADRDPFDENFHGTHVAGTIVDCTPGLPIDILPVRVLDKDGRGYASSVATGVRYAADHNAKVINLSLGGGHSNYIDEAVNYAEIKGATVCIAAGNEDEDTTYSCPAHLSTGIVVSAIKQSGKRASFSNYGQSVDVTAPGVDILSCVPGEDYESLSGTSMATPHISASAAMIKLDNPEMTPQQIESKMREISVDIGNDGWDRYYGAGLPKLSRMIQQTNPTDIELYSGGTKLGVDTVTISVGETMQLSASVLPDNASQAVTWESHSPSILQVDDNGFVTAKKQGRGTIIVQAVNGLTTYAYIHVVDPSKPEQLIAPTFTSLKTNSDREVIHIEWSPYSIPGEDGHVELWIKQDEKEALIGNFFDYDQLSSDLTYTRHGNLTRAGIEPHVGDTVQIGINTYSWTKGKGASRSETVWRDLTIQEPTRPEISALSSNLSEQNITVKWNSFTEGFYPENEYIQVWVRSSEVGKLWVDNVYYESEEYLDRQYDLNYMTLSDLWAYGVSFEPGDTVEIGISYTDYDPISWQRVTIK